MPSLNPLIALLLLIGSLLPALAAPAVYRIGIDDGLPNATIYSIAQDEQGYIWLGTTDSGLLRFDGYRFMPVPVLTQEEAKTEPFTDVGVLLIDRQQRVWAGLWGQGLSRLDFSGEGLTRFLQQGYQVQALLETDDGSIWVGTTRGLFRIGLDDQLQRIGASDSAQPLLHQRVWSLAKGETGSLWIGTSQGVHLWHPQDGLQPGRSLYATTTMSRQNEARALHYGHQRLWVGSRQGLLSFDPASWQRQHHPVPGEGSSDFPPIINSLYPVANEQLLLGSYEGVFRYDFSAQDYSLFRQQSALLPSLNVRSILVDRSGLFWVGTRDSGLFYTRFSRSAFSEVALSSLAEWQRRFELSVSSVDASQPETLWFGTSERLYRKDKGSGQIHSYETAGRVNRIASSDSGQTFFATDAGLYRYNTAQDKLEHYRPPFTKLDSTPIIREMVLLPDGQAWFGLWGQGVVYYNSGTGQSRHFSQDFQQQRANEVVQAMFALPDGRVWVGTRYSGLYLLDAELGVVQQLNTGNNRWLPSDTIQCLAQDAQQRLIICTNRGTLLWQPADDSFKVLYASDGLASDHMLGALHHDNRSWMLSAQGLSLLSDKFDHPVTFTRKDGLASTELNAGAISVASDGSLYIGSLSGLTKVEPKQLWVNQHLPTPVVTAVRIDHGPLQPLLDAQPTPLLQLSPAQSSLELHFSAMDFHDVSRNQYRFRLEGYDQDWLYSADRASAIYANLPPGRYIFQLMATNNHGVISEPVNALQLEVLPRWWQQRMYQLLLLAALAGLILLAHNYRLKHIRQVNRLLQQSVQEKDEAQLLLESKVAERTKALEQSSAALSLRTRQLEKSLVQLSSSNSRLQQLNQIKDDFISTVSHELRTPLTSIRGALSLVKNQVITPEQPAYQELLTTALHNSERLSELINDLLDVQKFAAGKMQLKSDLVAMRPLIHEAIQGMAEYGRRFAVSVHFESVGHEDKVLGDALRLRQVLDNLLSNAIKFSPADSQVLVSMQSEGNWLQVSVTDLGSGIPEHFKARLFEKFSQADASNSKKVQGTGLGLVICKSIIEALGGEIGFKDNQPTGACFWFRLRLRPEVSHG